MASKRSLCGALFLLPLTLLTSHSGTAKATTPCTVRNDRASSRAPRSSPKGIPPHAQWPLHARDLCDHSKAHYCLSPPAPPRDVDPGPGHSVARARRQRRRWRRRHGSERRPQRVQHSVERERERQDRRDPRRPGPSNAYSDLTQYRSQYGLPALPKCSGNPTGSLPACFPAGRRERRREHGVRTRARTATARPRSTWT